MDPLRIGTRASKLARWQSDWVAQQLEARGIPVAIVEITTQGDLHQAGPVASLGVQGAFTKEIEAALLAKQIDVAVHSLKDLPTAMVDGLVLAAVPKREDPADAMVANEGWTLNSLPTGARIGTGSLRRRAQLLAIRPDAQVVAIRGNIDTRLRKLDDGEYDAIVLAAAGLRRLGCDERIAELLAPPRMLPAPGQGALALQCRADDPDTAQILTPLNHAATHHAIQAERSLLAELEGGCSAPIAAWARTTSDKLALDGLVASLDGKSVLRASAIGAHDPVSLGIEVARQLSEAGASDVIAAARDEQTR